MIEFLSMRKLWTGWIESPGLILRSLFVPALIICFPFLIINIIVILLSFIEPYDIYHLIFCLIFTLFLPYFYLILLCFRIFITLYLFWLLYLLYYSFAYVNIILRLYAGFVQNLFFFFN